MPRARANFWDKRKKIYVGRVFGKTVEVEEYNQDIYGRIVARVYVYGKDLSLELVRAGLAWHFKKYSSDLILGRAQDQARKQKMGLWSISNPIPPWESRREPGRRVEARQFRPPER